MKRRCLHETTTKRGTRLQTWCADCGVLLSFADPVISAIVDAAPNDFSMQLRIAAALGASR